METAGTKKNMVLSVVKGRRYHSTDKDKEDINKEMAQWLNMSGESKLPVAPAPGHLASSSGPYENLCT